jgi:hypothetical protein
MKNTHIKAGQEVPIELRKEIYREALEVFENDIIFFKQGLCVLLPKLLWGLRNESLVLYKNHHFSKTFFMFPELEKFLKDGAGGKYTNKQRINFLKSVI